MKDTTEDLQDIIDECQDGSGARFPLARLVIGGPDKRGHEVRDILWAVSDFKIYLTDKGVAVHFADNPKTCLKQTRQFLDLGPELSNLHALMDLLGHNRRPLSLPWRTEEPPDPDANRVYHREMARGIAQALTGNPAQGKATLEALAVRVEKKLRNRARVVYFAICLAVTMVIGTLAALLAWVSEDQHVQEIALVAICGSIGALLSTAAGLKRLRPDAAAGLLMSWVYGLQRMLVGVLGAVVFYFALRSGIVNEIVPSGAETNVNAPFELHKLAFLSVLAGFSERMVPDLLNRNANGDTETDGAAAPTPAGKPA